MNRVFRRWRKNGIEISVDDFGTGYSSLGRLKDMAVDEIKIDRCFVNDVHNSAYNCRLLNNILDLADTNQVRTCCEGVESIEELQVLHGLRCSLVQGYLFARPCPPQQFEEQFVCADAPGLARVAGLLPVRKTSIAPPQTPARNEAAQTILDAENNIICLCDLETYCLYYLNPAGQRLFNVRDYHGKTCYKVLRGRDTPCPFCNNGELVQNDFSIWEQENAYCRRHFLLKDRIVEYHGRPARLEVGMDITRGELVSRQTQKRLDFAEKIVEYVDALSENEDYEQAVNRVLASVGDFYQADRACLFQPGAVHPGCWCNTFEWCALNIAPRKERLQEIPGQALSRWMALFEQNRPVFLFGPDPLRTAHPEEWKMLHAQGIQRLIAVPLRQNGKTIGFIVVDNPRYCIHDDSRIRVLAAFVLAGMRQHQNEKRYRALMMAGNEELLNSLGAGFWTLEIRKKDGARELLMNHTMSEMLARPEFFSPAETYHFFMSRVSAKAQPDVENALEQMVRTGKRVHVAYPWRHDRLGCVRLSLTGLLIEDTRTMTRLTGYCRRQAPDEDDAPARGDGESAQTNRESAP